MIRDLERFRSMRSGEEIVREAVGCTRVAGVAHVPILHLCGRSVNRMLGQTHMVDSRVQWDAMGCLRGFMCWVRHDSGQ